MHSCDTAITFETKSSMAHETKGLILDVLGRREEALHATATSMPWARSQTHMRAPHQRPFKTERAFGLQACKCKQQQIVCET